MKEIKEKVQPSHIHYPWATALGALVLVCYFYIFTHPELIAFYHLPETVFQLHIQPFVIVAFFFILLLEARVFHNSAKDQKIKISKLNRQIHELLTIKKQLQNKAQTFSGHADKLKLFISDRLLEYIEYDEKFLHFKSIASEVRHNGVICFDKVQTALTHAIENPTTQNTPAYQDALNSMIYLWDLLELSTTDNLALHISNQLCECEEHYYQTLLEDDVLSNQLSSPTFSAASAMINALTPFLEKPIDADLISIATDKEANQYNIINDNIFWIKVEKTNPLLGNENHIILLLENLINNAVFYANKKPYSRKNARIAIELINHHSNIRYSIYNHGPHIPDEDKDQIFQLGYSTRRVRENNGKGLGLYFVNEIIKGYEGKIGFDNISNREAVYSIRIAFADNTIITDVIETQFNDKKFMCKRATEQTPLSTIEWSSKEKVLSIEVSTQTTRETFSFTTDSGQSSQFLDPENESMPRWVIEVTQLKRSNKVTFTPRDINGVLFYVDIPSAESKLDYSEDENYDCDTDEQDLALLRENFVDPDTLIT